AETLQDLAHIRFLFVGAGAERTFLVEEARRRKLKNVIFVSSKPKEEMRRFWSLCDLALVHLRDSITFSEVLPSKLFEAMAMGIPILLVSPNGEASNLVEQLGVGKWVPAGRPGELAEKVVYLYNNTNILKNFSNSCIEKVPEFTRQAQAKKMIDLLETLLE
ncbi:MAG: glycosyltransferase, partial [Pseudomonadota bacterium]|nr:glycosyltransferase [Pseudomonadota bacterium]